jgi:enoyl-CoA hydratase/carnithine racemase
MAVYAELIERGIIGLTLSNPSRRNALDGKMFEDLAELWPRLEVDDSIDVVLLRGEGDNFSAGADLSAHLDRRPDIDEQIDRALLKTRFFPIPLVAAIRGACIAGGLELVLACDIRIAAEDARLGFPETSRGILPSGGGTMKLADQIGYAKAMDLLLTGRLISGREAERIGLVSECQSGDEVWDAALARAHAVAATSRVAARATKRAVALGHMGLYQALEIAEREIVAEVRRSGDPEEGKAAFLEKRRPVFRRMLPTAEEGQG